MNLKTLSKVPHNKAVAVGYILFFVFLIFTGFLSAIIPELAARLAALVILACIPIIACYGINDTFLRRGRNVELWFITGLFIFVMWPTYAYIKLGSMPAIEPRRVYTGISILIFVLLLVGSRTFRSNAYSVCHEHKLMTCSIFGYFLVRVMSCFISDSSVAALISVFWEMVNFWALYFIVASVSKYIDLSSLFTNILLWLSIILSVYVLFERATELNLFVSLIPISPDNESISAVQSVSRIRDGFFRAQGTFEHPLVLSEFSVISLCFGVTHCLFKESTKHKVLGLFSVFSSVYMIYASGSRSGVLLGVVAVGIIFLVTAFRARKQYHSSIFGIKIFVFLWLIITFLTISIPTIELISSGVSQEQKASSFARSQMLNRGLPSILEDPLLGAGVGEAISIAGVEGRNGVWTLDNQLLGVGLESGIPAVILFLLTLLYPVYIATKAVFSERILFPDFFIGGIGALLVLIVNRAFMWVPTNLTLGYILAACMLIGIGYSRKYNLIK